jgi:hypothetical protein
MCATPRPKHQAVLAALAADVAVLAAVVAAPLAVVKVILSAPKPRAIVGTPTLVQRRQRRVTRGH